MKILELILLFFVYLERLKIFISICIGFIGKLGEIIIIEIFCVKVNKLI